ncbi:IS3 family transposase [Brevibacterium aurantiacum]|nr:IS3 family transposase [Brevibacterium aurantiacum]
MFGKSQRLLCREATVDDVYEFIEAEKATYPIAMMCRVFKVSRASFYRWRMPTGPSPRARRHAMLIDAITAKYHECSGRAGRDQLARLLVADGIHVSESTVGAIMSETGLRAIRLRAFKTTTIQDPQANVAHIDNHMLDAAGDRDFSSSVPGTRLCGDITYLKTGEGWLYLSTVIDLCTGMVIGWSMAEHMRASLCIEAMAMARDHGYMATDQAIYHSDRGAQYTSARFQKWCAGNNVTQSMGQVGVCLLSGYYYHCSRSATHRELSFTA